MEDGIENGMSILINNNNNLGQENTEKKYAYLFIPSNSNEWEDTKIILDKNIAIEMSIQHKGSRVEVYWFNKKNCAFLPLYAHYKNGIYIESDYTDRKEK